MLLGETRDEGGMVGLHVLDDEIVDLLPARGLGKVREPFVAEPGVDRVEDDRLAVVDEIRIVGHAARNDVLALEEVDVVVVHADCENAVCKLFHAVVSVQLPFASFSTMRRCTVSVTKGAVSPP